MTNMYLRLPAIKVSSASQIWQTWPVVYVTLASQSWIKELCGCSKDIPLVPTTSPMAHCTNNIGQLENSNIPTFDRVLSLCCGFLVKYNSLPVVCLACRQGDDCSSWSEDGQPVIKLSEIMQIWNLHKVEIREELCFKRSNLLGHQNMNVVWSKLVPGGWGHWSG